MQKLFLALIFLSFNLFACKGGYDSCVQKVKDTQVIYKNNLTIPIAPHRAIVYSQDVPNAKVLKYNPYLSLYLIHTKKKNIHFFTINNHLSLGTAAVNAKKAVEGITLKQQLGLGDFATLNEKISSPSLLLNSCCSLEGIVTPKGIIQKKYIEQFINDKISDYSDFGVRVKDEKNIVVVKNIDPFVKNNLFKPGDCILTLDGKKVKSSALFMREVLFSKLGSWHKLKVKRGSRIIELKVQSLKRYGGGFLSDTFLESLGISFDENLIINKILDDKKAKGLKVGDKLVQVNYKTVENQQDVRDNIGNFKESAVLLFERHDFQFFIHFD